VANDLRMTVGRRVRELRNAKGISQEALAHQARLHRNYVGYLERGERSVSLDTLARILQDLEVSFAEFFAPFREKPVKRST
jgi:transcriptional regulator with XRE-family HTH domain